MRAIDLTALCLLPVAVVACAGPADPGTLEVEREMRGDTVIVRTVRGSVWDSVRLVEELRIGALEGAEEEMFGRVSELAPDGAGGVYVFDGGAPALRHYDAAGNHVATLGGRGSGPGEYQDAALGISVRPDGRVYLRDPRNARVNIYGADGTPSDHWPVASNLFTANAMVVDTAGHVYLKIMTGTPERNSVWPIALLHLDAGGQVIDTIVPPSLPGEPESAPGVFGITKTWEMSPLGDLVIGVNDAYRFMVWKVDGSVLVIEKAWEPVEVNPEERAQWEARNEWVRRTQGQYMTAEFPPVPAVKPPYRDLSTGADGRIWVRVHVAAEEVDVEPPPSPDGRPAPPQLTWREPAAYDVFDADGRFLGRVTLPDGVTLMAHAGDEVWGTLRGELDEQYVVRFRLDVPSS